MNKLKVMDVKMFNKFYKIANYTGQKQINVLY